MMLLQAQWIHRVPLYVTTVDMDVKMRKRKKCFPFSEWEIYEMYFANFLHFFERNFLVDKQMCSLFIVWVL